jgi:hypothetical protein
MNKTGPNFHKKPFDYLTRVPDNEQPSTTSATVENKNKSTSQAGSDDPVETITNQVIDKSYLDFLLRQQLLLRPKQTTRPELLSKYREGLLENSRQSNPFSFTTTAENQDERAPQKTNMQRSLILQADREE